MMKPEEQMDFSDILTVDYLAPYRGKETGAAQLFCDGGRKHESLDGNWHYSPDPYNTCLRQRWFEERYEDPLGNSLPVDYSFDDWPVMRLPCCWNLQEEKLFWYEGAMVFTRTFRFLPGKADERVFLRLGAANYMTRVFLNGQFVGSHEGGSTPCCFDLTPYLQKDNRVVIVVDSSRDPRYVPSENTDWFNYGGLYREIGLYRLPPVFIRDFGVALVPDGTFGTVRVTATLSEAVDTEAVFSIPALGLQETLTVRKGVLSVDLPCAPELWSPEHPKVYRVTLETGADAVTDEVGFREIRVVGREILLNGQPIFLKGISCHEDSIPHGKAVTLAECEQAILDAKALGCNFMRLAHYPHTEQMARAADRLGILLWEEIPVYWTIRFSDPEVLARAENQLRELILRDRNRASVIIWSVGNENPDSDARFAFMRHLVYTARALDGTRLLSAACLVSTEKNAIADRLADELDIIGVNQYFGWYVPNFDLLPQLFENSRPDKPVILTEFGADALYGHHGTEADKGTEECQAYIYTRQLREIEKIDYVRGMTPWLLYDFRSPRRVNVLENGFNRKGLISGDRLGRKLAWQVLHDFYAQK